MLKSLLLTLTILLYGCTSNFIKPKSPQLKNNLHAANYAKMIMEESKSKDIYVAAKKLYFLNKYIYQNGSSADCSEKASSLKKNLQTVVDLNKIKTPSPLEEEAIKSVKSINLLVINMGLKEICLKELGLSQ